MIAWFALALALFGLAAPAQAQEGRAVRHALIVGVNDGGGDLAPLRYAEDDAIRMAHVLEELGGFQPGEVQVLLSPSRAEVAAALKLLSYEMEAADGSLFLFYYSGHADARGLRIGDGLYPWDNLKQHIRDIPVDVSLGVLDACRSGSITRIKGASVSQPFLLEGSTADAEGEAWLTASAADEDAQESDYLRGSFFTHYLVSGLRGAADQSGDGWVSLNEAYTYAYDRTVTRTAGADAGTQHPAYHFQIHGNGDLRLTEVHRATAAVSFPEDLSGEIIVIRQPEGIPVAEVAKIEGKLVTLALEPGRYLLRRRADGQLYEALLYLEPGANHRVGRWSDARAEIASLKGAVQIGEEEVLLAELEDWAERQLADAQRRIEAQDLRNNVYIAGGLSGIVPGAGQVYNGQIWKGAATLGAFAAMSGGSVVVWDNPTRANPMNFGAAVLWGWSISDALYTQRMGDARWDRPETGLTLSLESAWAVGQQEYGAVTIDDESVYIEERVSGAHAAGFSADWIIEPGFSLGLDRVGVVCRDFAETDEPCDEWTGSFGGRMMLAPEWDRVRPGAFIGTGLRFGNEADQNAARLLVSGGVNVRWYLEERYFVSYEGRWELDGQETAFTHGLGLGWHVGR